MISRPTTDQLARDCAHELLEKVLPAVEGESAGVAVQMLENVLRNIAIRSAHEIAWMADEIEDMESYARDAAAAISSDSATIQAALDLLDQAPRTSLHLDDVVETYCRAGDAFSMALQFAMAAGDDALEARAARLLERRSAREIEAMADWSPVGR